MVASTYNFQDGTTIFSQKMNFIKNQQSHILDVTADRLDNGFYDRKKKSKRKGGEKRKDKKSKKAYVLLFQLLLIPSHFSGVVSTMSEACKSLMSDDYQMFFSLHQSKK